MTGSGNYDRKIEVLTPTVTVDEVGGETTTYSLEFSTWAKVTGVSSKRLMEVGNAVMIGTESVAIRDSVRNRGISKDHLLQYGGKKHVIHAVDPPKEGEIKFLVKTKG